MLEYQSMAKYYDLFYSNKSYEKEIDFILKLIGPLKKILDVGCGTGIHMHLLEQKGYQVDGLDLSDDMLKIAKTRTNGKLFQGNMLDYRFNEKYDVVISMFAVFNHLKNYKQFEKAIIHLYNILNEGGIFIIDLHNGRSNGQKEDNYNNYKRVMKWTYDSDNSKEYTNIDYIINNKTYHDNHEFMIYNIDTIKDILNKNKLKYKLYENYTFNIANDKSKNIIIVINK